MSMNSSMVRSDRGMPAGKLSGGGSFIGARHASERMRQPSAPCEAQLCSGVILKARFFSSHSVLYERRHSSPWLAPLLVEAGVRDGQASRVDAIHQRLL